MTTEMVADLANKAISQRYQAREYPLEMAPKARESDNSSTPKAQADASWEHLPAEQLSAATENVDVYLDDFISVFHGVPRERRQMICHLFHQINWVIRPNEESDTNRKDPISKNKLGQ